MARARRGTAVVLGVLLVSWLVAADAHAVPAPGMITGAPASVAPDPTPRNTTPSATVVPSVPAATTPAPTGTPAATGAAGASTASSPAPAPSPAATPPPAGGMPHDAADALNRARAAYEYGDIDQVVQFARMVAEGAGGMNPTQAQQAHALRYLGIGLFLTGRREGAENAFLNFLILRPDERLDPRTTRPDVVTFFESVRRRHAAEIRTAPRENPKTFIWNLLPPIGQFQNGHRARGITLGGIELVALATAITTKVLLTKWRKSGTNEYPDYELAKNTKALNYASVAILIGAYAYGVIDGIAHYPDPVEDEPDDAGGTQGAVVDDGSGASTHRARARTAAARWELTPAGVALTF